MDPVILMLVVLYILLKIGAFLLIASTVAVVGRFIFGGRR